VAIPEGVTEIGIKAFENCKALTAITLPSSIQTLGAGAFENCINLITVTIPDSVEHIEFMGFGSPFEGYSKLNLASQAAIEKRY
jgi:hypothetical protein